VQFIGVVYENHKDLGEMNLPLWIVTEFCDCSLQDQFDRLRQVRKKMDLSDIMNIALDILDALKFLHTLQPIPVLHHDLKPANILLQRGKAKLANIGETKLLELSNLSSPGSTLYTVPEGRSSYTSKSELYRLGLTVSEAISIPSPEPTNIEEWPTLIEQAISRLPTQFSNLLRSLLHENPEHRPTAEHALRSLVLLFSSGSLIEQAHEHEPEQEEKTTQTHSEMGGAAFLNTEETESPTILKLKQNGFLKSVEFKPNGPFFMTDFPPMKSLKGSDFEEICKLRQAEVERRRTYAYVDLVPPPHHQFMDDLFERNDQNITICKTKVYIPFEKLSNCDFVAYLDEFPGAFVLDGTGHDSSILTQNLSINTATVKRVVTETIKEFIKNKIPNPLQMLSSNILDSLFQLNLGREQFTPTPSTLSLALKVRLSDRDYVLTYNWGDSIILKYNGNGLTILEAPLNSDYGMGYKPEQGVTYNAHIYPIANGDRIVGMTDGITNILFFQSDFLNRNKLQSATMKRMERKWNDFGAQIGVKLKEAFQYLDKQDSRGLISFVRNQTTELVRNNRLEPKNLDDLAFFFIPSETEPLVLQGDHKCILF